ncbi:MAG TPA: polysaccharide deacetylase family protein, partial [Patescibacteria group bacterium]
SRAAVKQPKFNTETSKTIVKTLPPEIKKQVEIASISGEIRVPILMYHYVEYVQDKRDTIRESLNINPFIFDQQIQTLKTAGYTFMTASELGEVLDGKRPLPKNPILLTFDDGHWDFYTDVLPILKKYNVKATEYVISGFTGGSDFMTQKEVQAVVDSGLVDVGAHTVHHLALKGRTLATLQSEVAQSKKMLEETYHIKVVSFAYPYGSFDNQSEQVVKESGFTTSVSTVPGIEQSQVNRFFLYRLRPGRRTGDALLIWLKQTTFAPY